MSPLLVLSSAAKLRIDCDKVFVTESRQPRRRRTALKIRLMAWLALGNAVWRRRRSAGHVLRWPTLGREIGGDLAKILLRKAFCYWRHDRVVAIAASVVVQLLDEVALLLAGR